MKGIICSSLLFAFCVNVHATSSSFRQLLFMKNHVSAGVDFPVLFAKQKDHRGLGTVNVRMLPGFTLKVDYTYNFNEYVGVTSGSRVGMKVFGYEAEADAKDFGLPENISHRFTQMIPFFSIPFFICPRVFFSERSLLQADIGANVTFFVANDLQNSLTYRSGTANEQIFKMETQHGNQPQFTFHTAISYGHVLKNRNIVKIGAAYDYGRRNIIEGVYSFHDDDVMVGNGKIISDFSFLALEFSYTFTRASGIRTA